MEQLPSVPPQDPEPTLQARARPASACRIAGRGRAAHRWRTTLRVTRRGVARGNANVVRGWLQGRRGGVRCAAACRLRSGGFFSALHLVLARGGSPRQRVRLALAAGAGAGAHSVAVPCDKCLQRAHAGGVVGTALIAKGGAVGGETVLVHQVDHRVSQHACVAKQLHGGQRRCPTRAVCPQAEPAGHARYSCQQTHEERAQSVLGAIWRSLTWQRLGWRGRPKESPIL